MHCKDVDLPLYTSQISDLCYKLGNNPYYGEWCQNIYTTKMDGQEYKKLRVTDQLQNSQYSYICSTEGSGHD